MKRQDDKQLVDLMRKMEPLSTSTDFTELLMEQINPAFSLENDELAVKLRDQKEAFQLSPGIKFSDELMDLLVEPRPSQQVYGAIQPRRIWVGVTVVSLLLLALSFISTEFTVGIEMKLPEITGLFTWLTDFKLLVSCVFCSFLLLGIDYFLRRRVVVSST